MNVKTIKQHPSYATNSQVDNDIAVLELDSSVSLTAYPNIKPICLPAQGATFSGTTATVSGWGTVASGSYMNSHLHEVGVNVYGQGECGAMNQHMTEDMLCAGLMEGGKDACQGDSGGPLFTADPANNNSQTLIGVVSWGFGCAAADALGIYAEVSYFRDWLDQQMPDLNTCSPSSTVLTTPAPTPPPTPSGTGSGCKAVGAWEGNPTQDAWCTENCFHDPPFCPEDICDCQQQEYHIVQANTCRATGKIFNLSIFSNYCYCLITGVWAGSAAVNTWCNNSCRSSTSICPSSICDCL